MKKLTYALLLLAGHSYAQFAPGNLVIYRVGDGATTLTTAAAPVFLDEYTPTGTLVRSVPMPIKASGANKPLTASGTSFTEGMVNRSADGRFLVLTGYAQELGDNSKLSSTLATDVNRVIGLVDMAGNINTTT